MPRYPTFSKKTFKKICDELARQDSDLKLVLDNYGYPPMWTRSPGFETLVQIILEQQVSLASAKAAYLKLKARLGTITPETFSLLTDEDLKACYFSRQKISYTKHLAETITSGKLRLHEFKKLGNGEIHALLTQVKGIGSWTADVYLMMAMQRTDLFPLGDIALINSLKATKKLAQDTSREQIISLAEKWKPYQTVAAYLLWHAYLSKRKR